MLIIKGTGLNIQDNDGRTALMLTAIYGHKATAELLVKAKADINTQDKQGKTVLDHAKANLQVAIAVLIKKAGGK